MNNQAGKGDAYRPVKKSAYDSNYDAIDWGRPKKDVKNKKVITIDDVCKQPPGSFAKYVKENPVEY